MAYDVIGPLIDNIQAISGKTPLHEPGLIHKLDEDYFKKVEAIEFAVKYDDGRDPRGVLKGGSRVNWCFKNVQNATYLNICHIKGLK